MSIEIRLYKKGDENQIVELLATVFGTWPSQKINCTPEEYWRWKYLENPVKESRVTVSLDKDEIMGVHHIQYANLFIEGKKTLGSMSCDLAVHPNYRGMGLMSKISVPNEKAAEEEGLKLSYFITSNPILIKIFTSSESPEKRRPRFPSKIRNYTRISDIDLQLNKMPMENPLILKAGWTALDTLNKTMNRIRNPIKDEEGTIPEKIERFNDDYKDFWTQTYREYSYIVERSPEYLNWKYCDPRIPGYSKTVARNQNGDIAGYIIYSVNKFNEDYPVGYIVDLLTKNNNTSIKNMLISEAIDYFDTENVNIVNYQQVDNHPDFKILERHGFLDGRINIHLFYNKYGDFNGLDYLEHITPENTHLTWGDHDVLPVVVPKTR